MNTMRVTFIAALCVAVLPLTACFEEECEPAFSYCEEEEACTPAPSSCNHGIPSSATLVIHVSNPLPVLVRVYRGDAYETGTLIWSGAPEGMSWSLAVPLNDYSATALYVIGGDTTLVIHGDEVTYAVQSTCDGNCYTKDGGELDLRLED
jgi:hypothetical protein